MPKKTKASHCAGFFNGKNMATTPTNNPIPSESPQDLKFNAGKIDEFVSSLALQYIDRFGIGHYTIEGLRWLAQQAIAAFGWIPATGTFQTGATLTVSNQILKDEGSGEYYRWDGTFPKVVPASSSPASTGGTGVGAWISVGDSALRSMLATTGGAAMIGITGGGTVQDVIDGTKPITYRGYTVKDRLDEVISVMAIPGVKGDGVTDDQPAIQAFVSAMTHGALYFPGGHTYLFKAPLIISSNSMRVFGDKGYVGANATIIKCGAANMSAIKFTGYGYKIDDVGCIGFEVLDDSIAFGQSTTCTGFEFLRADGSKDIDSEINNCFAQHCKRGIYGAGANLQVNKCLFTSTLLPVYFDQITSQESRGFLVKGCRFHHCGGSNSVVSTVTYPELLTSSCVSLISTQSRGNVIENNFADAQIRTFFNGQMGRACSLSYNNILRAEGDVFIVNNTTLVGGPNIEDNFKFHGNIVVSDIGAGSNPQQYWHGYLALFTNVLASSIADNLTSNARKGGIKLVNSSDNIITNTACYDINGYFSVDGAIYSGVEMDATSNNNVVTNTIVRQSIGTTSARCVINNNGTNNTIGYFKGVGVTAQWVESSTAITIGILDGRQTGRKETYGDLAPTAGTWRRGDICWKLSVNAGGYEKYICTLGGTPGTWKQSGLVES